MFGVNRGGCLGCYLRGPLVLPGSLNVTSMVGSIPPYPSVSIRDYSYGRGSGMMGAQRWVIVASGGLGNSPETQLWSFAWNQATAEFP